MLELHLWILLAGCFIFAVAAGMALIRAAGKKTDGEQVYIIINASHDTNGIEFIIRDYIYNVASHGRLAGVILCDLDEGSGAAEIFNRMMYGVCEYKIISHES